jgi:hypothetical protein
MPEDNGSGRLDRIEALLEKAAENIEKVTHSVYLYEGRMTRVEALHEENEERWKAYREEQKARDEALDKRISDLVSAIGKLIARPPEAKP